MSRTNTGKTRLRRIYDNMKHRCYNRNNRYYHRYGGRGITVCDEWRESFPAFKEWALAHGYADNLTLDRIENDKGYSPDNCRWATYSQQMNNTSTTVFITIEGETKSLNEWAKISNVKPDTIRRRLKIGISGRDLLLPAWCLPRPKRQPETKKEPSYMLITIDGVSKTVSEWAEISGIKPNTIRQRYNDGISERFLLSPPRSFSPQTARKVEINGETKTISEWCKENNIKQSTFIKRLKCGVGGLDLISPADKTRRFK